MLRSSPKQDRYYYIHETDLVVLTFIIDFENKGRAVLDSRSAQHAENVMQKFLPAKEPGKLWFDQTMKDCVKQIAALEKEALADYEKELDEIEFVKTAMDLLKEGGTAVPVELWGMGEQGKQYRTVIIPKDTYVAPPNIWYYGQNDHQEPLYPCRSLMVGDIIVGYGPYGMPVYYMIDSVGFTKIKVVMVIKSKFQEDGESLYWNNKQGWVDYDNATVYSQEESQRFKLPTDGKWVEVRNPLAQVSSGNK